MTAADEIRVREIVAERRGGCLGKIMVLVILAMYGAALHQKATGGILGATERVLEVLVGYDLPVR